MDSIKTTKLFTVNFSTTLNAIQSRSTVQVSPFHCISFISKAVHFRFIIIICVCVHLWYNCRDFCDAEAKLLGYPPFNWEEWSFVVEKVVIHSVCTIST